MKIRFNDGTELQVQSVTAEDNRVEIKTILYSLEQLRAKFEDTFATKKMEVWETAKKLAEYTNYTTLYRFEVYPGGITGTILELTGKTQEEQQELLNASVLVAQIQAQSFTDVQALSVQAIYPLWDGNGIIYPVGYKVLYENVLYKCLQEHTSQPGWTPTAAPSLWAKVLIPDETVIPEWEQPDSTNGYAAGDKVTHNGVTYESLVDNNVWEPGVTGTELIWQEV